MIRLTSYEEMAALSEAGVGQPDHRFDELLSGLGTLCGYVGVNDSHESPSLTKAKLAEYTKRLKKHGWELVRQREQAKGKHVAHYRKATT